MMNGLVIGLGDYLAATRHVFGTSLVVVTVGCFHKAVRETKQNNSC
jgi:hypothetical protein